MLAQKIALVNCGLLLWTMAGKLLSGEMVIFPLGFGELGDGLSSVPKRLFFWCGIGMRNFRVRYFQTTPVSSTALGGWRYVLNLTGNSAPRTVGTFRVADPGMFPPASH